MTIRHKLSLMMSLLGSLGVYPDPLPPFNCSSTGVDGLPGSPPAVPGVGSGSEDDQNVERRQFNDLRDPT